MPRDEALLMSCECGVTVRSSDLRDLAGQAWLHARREHGMDLSIEQLMHMAERANPGADGRRVARTPAADEPDARLRP